MKKYFCYGKKDFCTSFECDRGIDCAHYDGSGGDYRDAPMTNADRIRSMSDEELAEFLRNFNLADVSTVKMGEFGPHMFRHRLKEWLQMPAEEADHA